jgi:hypothetical protein
MHPLVEALLPVVGGTFSLGLVAWGGFGLFTHRRESAGPRGFRLWSRPVPPSRADDLKRLEGPTRGAWGWAVPEDGRLTLFADPYHRDARHLRLGTPLQYRAVLELDGDEPIVAYYVPTAMLLLVVGMTLPIAPVLLAINHSLQAHRIDDRLAAIASEASVT